MSALDDPALVAEEYADESRLRKRAAAYTGPAGNDARDTIVAEAAAAAPKTILEVGCGWGELAGRLEHETGAVVRAIDLSPRMVELACEAGVAAQVADVQSLPFDDASFDVAVAAWMLYHVPDRPRALAELHRVLRTGGTLVAATNSRLHLIELRELVGSGSSSLDFSREDGEAQLARQFTTVRRVDIDGLLVFPDRAAVEEYVRSSIAMSPFVDNLPAEIAEPFVVTRAVSIFVASST